MMQDIYGTENRTVRDTKNVQQRENYNPSKKRTEEKIKTVQKKTYGILVRFLVFYFFRTFYVRSRT